MVAGDGGAMATVKRSARSTSPAFATGGRGASNPTQSVASLKVIEKEPEAALRALTEAA
jgi:hypothetical protein